MLARSRKAAPGKDQKPDKLTLRDNARLPWAWTGLCFGTAFATASNDGMRDVVNNIAPTTSSSISWTRDTAGNTAANMSNASYIQYPDNAVHDRPSTELTVYVRLKWAGTSDTFGGIMVNRISTSTPWSTWAINQNSTNGGWIEASTANAGTYWGITTAGVPLLTTEFSNIFLRWRSGELSTLKILGERGNTRSLVDSGTAPTGNLTYQAGESIYVNSSEVSTANFSGHYSQCMVWSRKLTDVEMQALVSDPFGWYSPRETSIGAGSGYPVFASGFTHASAGLTAWR